MKLRHLLWLCVGVSALFFACDRTTKYVETVAPGPVTCAQCHDSSNLITGKETEWAESVHGTGTAYVRASSASCAGCHSGNSFAKMVAAGENPSQVTEGDPNPTRQDCRACHMIHQTYTEKDFDLRTTKAVPLFAISGATFNGGQGNLCANCHQPRTDAPVPVNGVVSGISSHWGPHHGPQAAMLLGVGGAGGVKGVKSGHYGAVGNTCVTCHLGDNKDHHFEPAVATCQKCHPTATNFDVDGVQTEIQGLLDAIETELLNRGLLAPPTGDGDPSPAVSSAPTGEAFALWNYIYVGREDKSMGAHNVDYARALLYASLDSLGVPIPSSVASQGQAHSGGSK